MDQKIALKNLIQRSFLEHPTDAYKNYITPVEIEITNITNQSSGK